MRITNTPTRVMKNIFNQIRKELKSGTILEDVLSDFKQSFGNPACEEEVKSLLLSHLESDVEQVGEFDTAVKFTDFWDRIEEKKKADKRKGLLIRIRRFRAVAASVLIIVSLTLAGYLLNDSYLIQQNNVLISGVSGTISTAVLPDSSIVYLNANSEIRYNLKTWSKQREVYLNGEVFFEVTHDKTKPFVVHSSRYDIEVLGTRFNVKDYQDESEVVTTLNEGKVRISKTDECGEFKPVILEPDEQLIFDRRNCSYHIEKVNSELESAWKDNKLILQNSNFGELVIKLERKYGVKIEVLDSELFHYHYDGTIINETIDEVLAIIALTMPIDYSIMDEKISIRKKR